MYEYFIRVPFANGTTKEILAGITSFQPLYDPATTFQWPTSQNTGLDPTRMGGSGKGSHFANYTAQISGLVFAQGSSWDHSCERCSVQRDVLGSKNQAATVVITRTGPARIFSTPLTIQGCVRANVSSKWAVEYGMRSSRPMHHHRSVLRTTVEDVEEESHGGCIGHPDEMVFITMPNSTFDEIQSGDIVTTTSAAVTVPIEVDRRQVTNFETYYQTIANSLQIMLEIPGTEGESVDPDDPSAEIPIWDPVFAEDEEPWVPLETEPPCQMDMWRPYSWEMYTGGVPVVVHPMTEITSSQRCPVDTSGQVVLPDATGCEKRSSIHYLDEGARGPIFVDSSALDEILAEDPAEQELRAPILESVVSSPPEGEELVYRYYHEFIPHKQPFYVGETWVKKVVKRDEHKVTLAMSDVEPDCIVRVHSWI